MTHTDFEARFARAIIALTEATRSAPSDDIRDLLSRMEAPVKMALAGEFSSGKTTLARMLLGREFVSTKAAASAMPTVRFQYGTDETFCLVTKGKAQMISGVEALDEKQMRAADYLIITTDQPFLKQVEIYDTPGTSDPSRDHDQIVSVAEQVEIVLWCTNATQAWRQSERLMWESLPARLHKQSLLIVTHVDLEKVKASLGRLMKRMTKEAGSYFHSILAMDLLTALKSRFDAKLINNPIGWEESGGAACLQIIKSITTKIRETQIAEAEALLGMKFDSIDAAPTQAVPDNGTTGAPVRFAAIWDRQMDELRKGRQSPMDCFDFLQSLEGDKFGQWSEPALVADEIRARIDEAIVFLKQANNVETAKDVIAQLNWEFKNIVASELVA